MKRTLFITTAILSFAICESVFAATIIASSETTGKKCGENCTWTLDEDGKLTISGNGSMNNYSQGGSPWYDVRSKVTSVEIPDTITNIGNYAFFQSNLSSITIPNSVTSIGSDAFTYSKLASVSIPSSVTSIGLDAFRGTQLTSITVPSSVTSINYHAFRGNSSLSEMVFEGDLSKIKFQNGIFEGTSSDLVIYFKEGDENRTALENILKKAGNNEGQKQATLKSYKIDEEGNQVVSKTYEYNASGILTRAEDANGIVYEYDSDGNFTRAYAHGVSGSEYRFDENGNLTGMSKKGAFTPAEAAAATHDGNDNVVSITW